MRIDTGVYEGGEISLYYDPMIAKLVTHAPTREEAIAAQADALDAFAIEGFRHNILFLVGADAAQALASGKALDRIPRPRSFPTGFIPSLRKERPRASLPRSPPRWTMCSASESAAFPASSQEPRSRASSGAAVRLGDSESVLAHHA